MSAFAGTYYTAATDNLEAYSRAIGVSDEMIEKARVMEKTGPESVHLEIVVDGKKVTKNYHYKGQVHFSETLTVGEEVEITGMGGRTRKVLLTKEGDSKFVTKESGPYDSTTTYDLEGDEIAVTLCGGGVTATRKYKKL